MRFLPSFISALVLAPAIVSAEGTCTWQDVEPLLSQAPRIQKHLVDSLEIEPTGIANRLGPQYHGLTGARVAPYRFRVKPKEEIGPFHFDLVIHADLDLFDSTGYRLQPEQRENAATFREVFTHITFERIKVEPEITRGSSSEPSGLVTNLDDPRILAIRKKFNAINLGDHNVYAIPFSNDRVPVEAKVVFHQGVESREIEYITVDGSLGEHSGFSESFYFEKGRLIFVFQLESNWTYHPQDPKQTIDSMVEKRYYFEDGVVFAATIKEYEGGGPERLAEAAENAAKIPLDVEGRDAVRLLARGSRLLMARQADEISRIYEVAFTRPESN